MKICEWENWKKKKIETDLFNNNWIVSSSKNLLEFKLNYKFTFY